MHDSDEDPAWTTAMHEAGHIVTSMHWGVPVVAATIIPTGDDGGSVTHEPVVDYFDWDNKESYCRELAIREIAICYAGAIAGGSDNGDHTDLEITAEAVRNYIDDSGVDLTDEQELELRDEAWTRADEVILTQGAIVERYAIALLRHKTLTEKQIRRIWLTATKPK